MRIKNSHTGTILEFPNRMLMAFHDECLDIRAQISFEAQSNRLSGWNDKLNEWIMDRVGMLTADLDEFLDAENEGVLTAKHMPQAQVRRDLTGDDKNLRQLTNNDVRNPHLQLICQLFDTLAVLVTHFDSRNAEHGIDNSEHSSAEAILSRIFKVCTRRGGAANKRPLITGVLPNDLDNSFNHSGEYDYDSQHQDIESMRDTDFTRTGAGGTTGTGPESGAGPNRREPGVGSPSTAQNAPVFGQPVPQQPMRQPGIPQPSRIPGR